MCPASRDGASHRTGMKEERPRDTHGMPGTTIPLPGRRRFLTSFGMTYPSVGTTAIPRSVRNDLQPNDNDNDCFQDFRGTPVDAGRRRMLAIRVEGRSVHARPGAGHRDRRRRARHDVRGTWRVVSSALAGAEYAVEP